MFFQRFYHVLKGWDKRDYNYGMYWNDETVFLLYYNCDLFDVWNKTKVGKKVMIEGRQGPRVGSVS